MTKKIISFSLWGDNILYIGGAFMNVLAYEKFLPDYTCRFYLSDYTDIKFLGLRDSLVNRGCEVILRQAEEDNLGLYWRFEPFWDETIDRFIVRDTDSRPGWREAAAVREWEEADRPGPWVGYPFHIIRDHPQHGIPILGGTFGVRTKGNKSGCLIFDWMRADLTKWKMDLIPDKTNPRGIYHNSDQIYFDKKLWPRVRVMNFQHDRYFNYPGVRGRNLGEPEDGRFIGMTIGVSDEDRGIIKSEFGLELV